MYEDQYGEFICGYWGLVKRIVSLFFTQTFL